MGALLAVAAFVPAVANARILSPADSLVKAAGQTVTLQDVYGLGDNIGIKTSTSTSCKLYDDSDRLLATLYPKLSGSAYYASYRPDGDDRPGEWVLNCGGEIAEFVVDDVHESLWLEADGFDKVVDDYLAAGGPKSTYYAKAAPPPTNGDRTWVHSTGWYTVMYTALPAVSYQFAAKIPKPGGAVISSSTKEPYESYYKDGGQAFSTTMLRLALAAKTMAVYMDDPSTPSDPAEAVQAEYQAGIKYWGDYLASIPDWRNAVLPNAYKDGAGRFVYCGTGKCYAKDGKGNKIAPSGSLTKLTKSMNDLDHGFLLMGLTAAYDWMYDELPVSSRRAWRNKIVYESLRYRELYGVPESWATVQPNRLQNLVTNNHTWVRYSAPAIAAMVLWDEMAVSGSIRNKWIADADGLYSRAFAALGRDGADHQGIGYWQFGLEFMIRYADALRTTMGDDRYYKQPWLQSAPKWLMYQTHPNGQRVNFGAAEYSDRGTLGFLSARLASQYGWRLGQTVAWYGHNRWTYGDAKTRRDVLDILWWDSSVTPTSSYAQAPRNRCFANKGMVSVRTGWGAKDAHLAYRGGGIVGTHDDPDIGSFVLYKQGHLVTSDGMNKGSKRTALHSTLLVDGKGQHGDGTDFLTYAPEGSGNNNGVLTTYLDNSLTDGSLDVATFASDLTQLYRYDSSDTPYANATNVEQGGKRLYDLRRHMVWLGDAVLVLDRWRGNASFRMDWNLNASKVQDLNRDGREDGSQAETCPVRKGSRSGYYLYRDGNGKNYDVRYAKDKVTVCPAGGSCTTSNNLTQVNLGKIAPVKDTNFTKYSCDKHVAVVSSTGKVTVSAESSLGGKLDVIPLEPSRSAWSKQVSATDDGGKINGVRLNRRASAASGTFMTALFPYAAGSNPTASVSSYNASGGTQIEVAMPHHDATVLFANPGQLLVKSTTTTVRGDLGVIVEDETDVLKVAQVVGGTSLVHRGKALISATAPVTAGLTYTAGAVSGYVQPSTSTTLTLVLPHMSPSSVASVTLDGKAVSWSRTSTGIQVTVPRKGTLKVESTKRAQTPVSTCY